MKHFSVILTLLGLLIASSSVLAHGNTNQSNNQRNQSYQNDNPYVDRYRNRNNGSSSMAKVVDIRPVYEYSNYRNTSSYGCNSSSRSNSHTGLVLGSIIGGVIGHELGHDGYSNSHRNGATAAGVIVGAVAGNHYDSHNSQSSRNCNTSSRTSRKLKGYEMTYYYQGRTRQEFVHREPPRYFRIEDLRHYR